MNGKIETLVWKEDSLQILDQLQLPAQVTYVVCRTVDQVAEAIRKMQVRGAPAIGVAAAYGMVLAVRSYDGPGGDRLTSHWRDAREAIAVARPTAVNLIWALDRMQRVFDRTAGEGLEKLREATLAVAQKIARDDVESNRAMGKHGAALVANNSRILTHCNTGSLATAGYGTALGVIRAAREAGKDIHVWVDETRPYLQGARLTSWELEQEKIPYTLIADSMAAILMRDGKVDLVVVGADRITAAGDVANKIGTYSLAVLCHHHHVPFYVAAPLSSIDRTINLAEQITIEERPADELTMIGGTSIAPAGARVYNPSFDVTPSHFVRAIITPVGLLYPPFSRSIARAFDKQALAEGGPSGEV
jgi:methylthioribose-1-phosphate isomerase